MADEEKIPTELQEAVLVEMFEIIRPHVVSEIIRQFTEYLVWLIEKRGTKFDDPETAAMFKDPDQVMEVLESGTPEDRKVFIDLTIPLIAYYFARTEDPEEIENFNNLRRKIIDARPEQHDPSHW